MERISGRPRAISPAANSVRSVSSRARALGEIDHDGDLRLVVERQQLDGDALGREQHAHRERRDADADQEQSRPRGACG